MEISKVAIWIYLWLLGNLFEGKKLGVKQALQFMAKSNTWINFISLWILLIQILLSLCEIVFPTRVEQTMFIVFFTKYCSLCQITLLLLENG